MKLLIDTNVILDVLLKREPFVGNAAKILQLIERQNVQEYVSTSAITDIYYIACRQLHDKLAVKKTPATDFANYRHCRREQTRN